MLFLKDRKCKRHGTTLIKPINFFHNKLLLLYFLRARNTFTFFYNMDKERFTQFRSDFVQFIAFIKKGDDVDAVLTSFLREYPELTVEFVLPHLVKGISEERQSKTKKYGRHNEKIDLCLFGETG